MTANELSAALGALLNGADPDTGEEVDFDDDETIVAECADTSGMAGVLSDGSPQRFTVTGFKVIDGRLVLELKEEEEEPQEPPGDLGDLYAGQPDVPPFPPQ